MKKFLMIFKWVGISLIIIIVCLVIWMKWVIDTNKIVHNSNEKIISPQSNSDKKALIIYEPSRTDITAKMANTIADTLKDSGYEVTINYPSENLKYDISKYQVVVFGTPIYVGKHSIVLEKYINSIKDYAGKKVFIFATGGNKQDVEAVDYLADLVKGAGKIEKAKFVNGDTNNAISITKALIK